MADNLWPLPMCVQEEVNTCCDRCRPSSMRVLDIAIGPLAIAQGAYARLPSKQPTGTPVPRGVEGVLVRASTKQRPRICHLSSE